jgi:hypothetical protein
MEGNCPQCRVRLDLPVDGAYQCERCRLRFEVLLGSPRPIAAGAYPSVPGFVPMPGAAPYPAPAMPMDPALQAPCASHPANPAQFTCERCGDFMCRLCTTPIEGRLYCPKCFDLLYTRGALHFAQRQFTLPGLTLGLGLGGFVCGIIPCVCAAGGPLCIASLWTGFRALKEYQTRPDLPNRGTVITGLVFGSLGLLATIAWIVALLMARGI